MSKEKDILSEILGFDPEGEDRAGNSRLHPDDPNLKVIPKDGNPMPLYKSWDDITAWDSPWGKFLESPRVLAVLQLKGNREPWEREKITRSISQEREDNLEYVRDAHELFVEQESISRFAVDPETVVKITSAHGPIATFLQLGGIVEAVKPDLEDVLKLANNSPWGPDGGYQTLANITGKPVNISTGNIRTGDYASTRYLPVSTEKQRNNRVS